MKQNIMVWVMLVLLGPLSVSAQKTDRKAEKQAKKLEREKEVQGMLDSKEFVFVAQRALPSSGPSVDLTGNPNYLKFHPDSIEGRMPFFGRAYSGANYESGSGLIFEGKPTEFTMEKGKRNYEIKAKVKSPNDSYSITLSVFTDGSGTLTVSCVNRSTISYQGEIRLPEKSVESE